MRFLYIAYGSNCELETQILLFGDLNYIETHKLEILLEGIAEVERMLKALVKSLERKTLDPLNPRALCPQLIGRKAIIFSFLIVIH